MTTLKQYRKHKLKGKNSNEKKTITWQCAQTKHTAKTKIQTVFKQLILK